MEAFNKLLEDCMKLEESSLNCSITIDEEQLESIIPPTQDEELLMRMKVVAGFFICICVVGFVTNIALLVSLFVGGKEGTTYKAPSTILIANLGKVMLKYSDL